ncbi:MAG: COG2426 family protein [Candidatus Geothermincolia bacterium]
MQSAISDYTRRFLTALSGWAGIFDGVKNAITSIPAWAATVLMAMIPIFELRGAIPTAVLSMDMKLWQAFAWAVLGNMIPIPFILLFLEPFSAWLSRHSRVMERFFRWLFSRTRRRHSETFEQWKYVGLMIFVAIPLPMTGGWSGALAAFVFAIPFWPALLYIFLGVLIAGGVVSLATSFQPLLGWPGMVGSFAILSLTLIFLLSLARRDSRQGETPTPPA